MFAKYCLQRPLAAVAIALALTAGPYSTAYAETTSASPPARTIANRSYRLAASIVAGCVCLRLDDLQTGLCVAEGPCLYHAVAKNGTSSVASDRLESPSFAVEGTTLTIRGRLLHLDIEHRFTATLDRELLEERIVLKNNTRKCIALTDFEAGMQRRVADQKKNVLSEFAADRFVAVPFRHQAIDPKGRQHDYSFQEIVANPGFELRLDQNQVHTELPSRHRASEGWAWTHGATTLGIFKFCQENMQFSVISTHFTADGTFLRFGGAAMIADEPAALGRIAPDQTVDLGLVRFQTVRGGYVEAMYAYRAMLDEQGCRFPKDFNPPVHWEQLYDMPEAWNDRPHRYTKAIVEREAAKGRAYSCEALYLDPGWDTEFGTFLWGENWLGPRKQFIDEMQSKYGLKVSLHCPLATWMSHPYSWGPHAVTTYPIEARRTAPDLGDSQEIAVPALRERRRNLALLPSAKSNASSVYAEGANPRHQIAHLNNGWYGNNSSWIPGAMPAWAEIDLGAAYSIAEVRLGNDHTGLLTDRAPSELRILTATDYAAASTASTWHEVARYSGEGIRLTTSFAFPAVTARWVRVDILKSGSNELPRLDEIEVYEANAAPQSETDSFLKKLRRGPKPISQAGGATLCLGSKQYLATAEERLLANCADGAVFLMFDGNWWNGGCVDPSHGHPVPYRMEDHIRANLDLCQRIHAKYPKVLIEMHDMIAGGNPARATPIYYKYGLPGSYDMNWGFELMWNPTADVVEGRGLALYYSNMGCNVPIYTHINLTGDNVHCLTLWWYISTCRHLGIGGKHADPKVVDAQQRAMKWYRAHDRFYKRGDFFGIDEMIHLHVLPEDKAFTVNVFNFSDRSKPVGGSIDLKTLGLDPAIKYVSPDGLGAVENGRYQVKVEMPAWGARAAAFFPAATR
jgi:hypothetical protein